MSVGDHGEVKVTVHVPADPPVLTRQVARILLELLIEYTDVEALDGPRERGLYDC